MSQSLFRAWDIFLLRAPLALDRPELPAGDHLEILLAAAADPVLREAIALATPSLSNLLDRIASGRTDRLKPAQLRRAALVALRYDIRMRSRPTPFGLFSGVTGGRFDSSAKLEWGERHRTRTHVDMQWLLGLVHELESDPDLLPALTVQTHSALTRRGDRVVLDCPSTLGSLPVGKARAVVSVRNSPPVAEVLRAAQHPIRADKLAEHVAGQFGVATARVAELLRVLIAEEILLTNLRPPLDGGDPLRHVLGVLDAVPGQRVPEALRELDRTRALYDRTPIGAGQALLNDMISAAHQLNDHPTPLHVDTRLDVEARLPHAVAAEVERAVELMWRMSRDKLGLFALRGYHRRFLERYGADRLVPILELLDDARGLGAPAGYGWPATDAAPEDPAATVDNARVRLVHRLVATAIRDRRREVELSDATLSVLAPEGAEPLTLPNSCEVTVHVITPSMDALTAGDFRIVLSPSPGSHQGGATFARFADLLPGCQPDLAEEISALPAHVSGAIRADIAFLPRSGKAGNLAHTTAHSGRRISVGLPDADGVDEIRLQDVAVGATLDRMCAIHLPTGREIVPSLGNMISPTAQAPNAARLLWEIGLEGQRLWEPWQWGPLADAPFVPRIRHGRFVLAPAVWRLDALHDSADFAGAVSGWRREWAVPRRVLVVSNDQRLLLDLTNARHLELLQDEIRKDSTLVAQEVPGDDDDLSDGIGGGLVEVVVPLSRRDAPQRSPHVAYHDAAREDTGIGGEWLYLKLYGASRNQDDLVRCNLPDLVAQARQHGMDRWFFIRYNDPDGPHLRVRLHGPSDRLWGAAVPALGRTLARWRREGLLGATRIDQYDPEAERYGGMAALTAAEQVFQEDSEAAMALLRLAGSDNELLDAFAAVSVAALAAAFGPPDTAADPDTTADRDDAAAAWLSMTGSRRALPDLYRSNAARWRRTVDPYGGWAGLLTEPYGPAVLDALTTRDAAVRRLRSAVSDTRTPHHRLVGSLMHMTCNRLFGGDTDREVAVVAIARGAVQDNLNRRRHLT